MKRHIIAVVSMFGLAWAAVGSPSQFSSLYNNNGYTTNLPVIDATTFVNSSIFVAFTLDNGGNGQFPYSTTDTLYYTNEQNSIMLGEPGFRFDYVTATTRTSSKSIDNQGSIISIDVQTAPEFPNYGGTTVFQPGTGFAYPSMLQLLATNINNEGSLTVGNDGALEMIGHFVTNNHGALVAGDLTGNDPYDLTSIDQAFYTELPVGNSGGSPFQYFTAPPTFFDLFWGATNGTLALDQQDFPNTPGLESVFRGAGPGDASLPFSGLVFTNQNQVLTFGNNPEFATYVDSYTVDVTNIWYNIVFVNTNFVDTNLSSQVVFSPISGPITVAPIPDPNGESAVVQFSIPCFDVITQQAVTNAIYLVDLGAFYSNTVSLYTNAPWLSDYAKPDYFEIDSLTPIEFTTGHAPDDQMEAPDIDTIIYPGLTNTFENKSVPYSAGIYGVQVGWNPEDVNGYFTATADLLGTGGGLGSGIFNNFDEAIDIPDPTNEPARIDVEGTQLDLTGSRIRAEGLVTMQSSNLVGGSTTGVDWGTANASLGSTSGTLMISNLFPTTFQRVRGNIYAWAANFVNVATNAVATNNYTFHVLVVDQSLRGNFQSTVRDLAFHAKTSVDVEDNLTVIDQTLFDTTNLTLNSSIHLTQNAASLTSANLLRLQNFLNNTNGVLVVDDLLNLGLNSAAAETPPSTRKYSINSITNFGTIMATSPLFESRYFENDGFILTSNEGSMIIEAQTIGLGLAFTNQNLLLSEGNLTLSAQFIEASNSDIATAGHLTLETSPGGQITDFVPGTSSTNVVINNFWTVEDGFSLPVKPATGDLFGTQIRTIATNFTVADHVWAGADLGANSDGFLNNVVIGHLTLSRQTENAELRFTGAGAHNGMYVDYLELDPTSFSYLDYRNGLIIDPNLTIYFADSNVDPLKLEEAYSNRLVWVQGFAGPNSTKVVPLENSTSVCFLNAALADSPDISFFGNTPNAYNQPYVLNDPSNPENVYPCPGGATTTKEFIARSSSTNYDNLTLSSMGEGTISPPLKQSQLVVGHSYTLTANHSPGWVFAGWTASGVVLANTNSPTVTFPFNGNIVLTANFIENPFVAAAGSYSGLFYDPNAPMADQAGFFTFILRTTGSFAGHLSMGASTYSFAGVFTPSGTATVPARSGSQSLSVNLQLAGTSVGGSVSNSAWKVPLSGNLAAPWTARNPSPYAGRYTLGIPGTNETGLSIGDSWAELTVDPTGLLTVGGRLADGPPAAGPQIGFSQTVPVSRYGQWPFYTYVASGKDMLVGWIDFETNGPGATTLTGTNLWVKGKSNSKYYGGGFTNIFHPIGSAYSATANQASGLTLVNPTLTLSGGGLPENLNNPLAVSGKVVYSGPNLTLSINPKVGSFTGQLLNSVTKGKTALSGVVLQGQGSARGYFLGTNESGAILLQGN